MGFFRRLLFREPELRVDPRRINAEIHAEERRAEDGKDIAYKARVRYRMDKGLTASQLAPLVQVRHPEKVEKVE